MYFSCFHWELLLCDTSDLSQLPEALPGKTGTVNVCRRVKKCQKHSTTGLLEAAHKKVLDCLYWVFHRYVSSLCRFNTACQLKFLYFFPTFTFAQFKLLIRFFIIYFFVLTPPTFYILFIKKCTKVVIILLYCSIFGFFMSALTSCDHKGHWAWNVTCTGVPMKCM